MSSTHPYDFEVTVRKGVSRPLYGSATVPSGTLTISGSPAPSFTLLDSTGAVVSGFNGIAVTGYDVSAALSVRVWYVLATAGLAVGAYIGILTFVVVGSDGVTRTVVVEGLIEVLSTASGLFSYDVTTDRGRVRALSTDVDASDFTFSDAEIDAFLSLKGGNVWEAAALACETWARSRAKLSKMIRASDGTMTQRYSMQDLLELAKALRQAGISGTLQTGSILVSEPNELLDSYRPQWRGITDLPVVE